jgi:glycosyltransferase involved in cell wall biosynthesis
VSSEIERLGVADFVQYRGFVSEAEKLSLYRRAWVAATPSLIEGWGLTVMEANACGTPAVSFDAPGLNESIVNGLNGLLASDDRQFVNHLCDILKDASLRRRLEAGAVQRADEFNWDDTARQSLDILEEAVAGSAVSRPV